MIHLQYVFYVFFPSKEKGEHSFSSNFKDAFTYSHKHKKIIHYILSNMSFCLSIIITLYFVFKNYKSKIIVLIIEINCATLDS